MKRRISIVFAAVFSALPAVPALPAEPGGCIADWSVAARIVEEKNLASVEDVSQRIRAQNAGSVVRTVLCEAGGSYVYRLTVKDAKGALKNMTIDARSGR